MIRSPAETAAEIIRAHDERRPFDESTARLDLPDLDAAYAVQAAHVARLTERHGAPIGYKIGLTSPVMQEMCGVHNPIAGVVLKARHYGDGSQVALGRFGRLGLEFEICVRLGADLLPENAPFSRDDVATAVDAVCASFELIDDRHADYARLDARNMAADNSWNAGVVLADFVAPPPDLGAVEASVERNGEVIDKGRAVDALGHPLSAVAWLADHLAHRGAALRAGEFVLTGSLARTRFPAAGERYRLTLTDIGSVEVAFTA